MKEAIFMLAVSLGSEYGIDPTLILSIVQVESNYKPAAIGKSHKERGLMQLRPKYFPDATFDIEQNMRMGVKHLVKMRKACINKYKEAWFICYNLGPNGKLINHPKKFPYYTKVMVAYGEIARNRGRATQSQSTASYSEVLR